MGIGLWHGSKTECLLVIIEIYIATALRSATKSLAVFFFLILFKSRSRLQQMDSVRKTKHWGGASRRQWKYCVSQTGARASYFAWVGSEMSISIFCSSEHWNVLTNAIWVTKIHEIFCGKTWPQCSSALVQIMYGDHRWVIWLRWHNFIIYFYYIKQLLRLCSHFKVVGFSFCQNVVFMLWVFFFFIFFFYLLPPPLSLSPFCLFFVTLCRDVLGSLLPCATYQGRQ